MQIILHLQKMTMVLMAVKDGVMVVVKERKAELKVEILRLVAIYCLHLIL